jgi:hypothetical protein
MHLPRIKRRKQPKSRLNKEESEREKQDKTQIG